MTDGSDAAEPQADDTAHDRHKGAHANAGQRQGRRFTLLHHSTTAMTIASAMWLAEGHGLLDALDVVMLRVVAPAAQSVAPDPLAPIVVSIDPQAYADDFGMRSPLPREPLVARLQAVLSAPMRQLVIDLQIEPAAGEDVGRPIDALLLAAAAEGRRIVLPLPEPRTPALDAVALRWIRTLCRGGVEFGDARLRDHFGSVVRYDLALQTLAMVALAGGSGSPATEGDPAAPCALAEMAPTLDQVLQPLGEPPSGLADSVPLSRTAPIAPSVVRQLHEAQLPLRADIGGRLEGMAAGRTVVLGGSYDARDRFRAHGGDGVSGAVLHAAVIGSHGKVKSNHLVAWALEIAIGVVMGVVFQALWGARKGLARRADAAASGLAPTELRRALAFYVQSAYAVFVWLLPVLLSFGLLYAAGWWIDRGFWLNPAPMAIGMFLHALLLEREHASAPGTLLELHRHHPGIVYFQLPFSVFAVGWSLTHH